MLISNTLEALLRPGDDRILKPLAEIHEVRTVAGYPDKKVGVALRMVLGVDEGFPVDHVELDLADAEISPGSKILNEQIIGPRLRPATR